MTLTWHAEWRADCAYLIMWHADYIINFLFYFFKIKNNINEVILIEK